MKMRLSLTVLIIAIGAMLLGAYKPGVVAKDPDREKLIIAAVTLLLEKRHFQEQKVDDVFSRKAFGKYLERLDGGKRFLTKEDLDLLDDYEEQIDDAIRQPDVTFFELSYEVINEAIGKVEKIYPRLLDKPFNFTIEEEIELDGDKLEFARDDAELEERWKAYLKYETLTRLVDKIEEQESAEDAEGGKKTLAELEQEAREDTRETMDDWFERMRETRRSDRFEMYLNTITNIWDPHTDYFNPKDKEDFDINMSRRLEGIGARLQRSGSYTKVVSIVPGGPAWKQKELHVDDVIYAVQQEGEESVDINGMHIDDVVSMIRGKKGTKVTLTVKNVDGDISDITIIRDEVILDEGLAQSAILEFPGRVDKVGYIKLPRFYADFENPDGKSCAEDVALELEKLKEKEVEGIILDLRNNSGGSLNDVVQMSGLFIKQGPIVQVKGRDRGPHVFRDKDPEVRYRGPLIVMVNGYSASASEILAAALQDYGRAIIVGSKSTFGKGTVQRFYDLDRALRIAGNDEKLGELKLTVQKFYRVNGGSTQLKGVVPDVVLPDRLSYIDIGEKQMDYPMPWTEIEPVEYSQDIVDLSSKASIERKSRQRVENSPVFTLVEENARRVQRVRELSVVPLQLEDYRALMQARREEAAKYKDIFEEIDGLQVSNLPEDMSYIQMDSSRISRNDAWIESIHKDAYIDESLSIMHDMIVAGVAINEHRP